MVVYDEMRKLSRTLSGVPPTATAYDLLVPEQCVGNFRIVKRIGRGAFGEVYSATDISLSKRHVALKILRAQIKEGSPEHEKSKRELSILSSVWHPSIIQLLEYGLHDNRVWFAMPYFEARTLAEYIRDKNRRRLSRREAQDIFVPLAEALEHLHGMQIRHQDIKPENILIRELNGRPFPVLIDFGLGAHNDEQHLVGGTPLYVAPEVARKLFATDTLNQCDPDLKADIFSFGLTLIHCLAPMAQESVVSARAFLRRRSFYVPPVPARDVLTGESLDDIAGFLEKLTHKSPRDRPSAQEVSKGLRNLTLRARTRDLARRVAPWVLLGAVAGTFAVVWFLHTADLNQKLNRRIHEQRITLLRATALELLNAALYESREVESIRETQRQHEAKLEEAARKLKHSEAIAADRLNAAVAQAKGDTKREVETDAANARRTAIANARTAVKINAWIELQVAVARATAKTKWDVEAAATKALQAAVDSAKVETKRSVEEEASKALAAAKQSARAEGISQGERTMLLRLLQQRFGTLLDDAEQRVRTASAEQLVAWTEQMFRATTLDELLGN